MGGFNSRAGRNQGNMVLVVSSAELGGRFKNMHCAVNKCGIWSLF